MRSIHRWTKHLLCMFCSLALLAGCGAVTPTTDDKASETEVASEGPTEEELRAQQAALDFAAGIQAMKSGNHKMAREVFLAMTEKYPEYAGPWVNLAILYHRSGENDAAEKAFKTALGITRDNPEIFNQLAIFYRDTGKFYMARDVYEEGISLHPDYAPLRRNAGILYELYMQQNREALEHYQAYIKLKPDDKEVETWIADLTQRLAR